MLIKLYLYLGVHAYIFTGQVKYIERMTAPSKSITTVNIMHIDTDLVIPLPKHKFNVLLILSIRLP